MKIIDLSTALKDSESRYETLFFIIEILTLAESAVVKMVSEIYQAIIATTL